MSEHILSNLVINEYKHEQHTNDDSISSKEKLQQPTLSHVMGTYSNKPVVV